MSSSSGKSIVPLLFVLFLCAGLVELLWLGLPGLVATTWMLFRMTWVLLAIIVIAIFALIFLGVKDDAFLVGVFAVLVGTLVIGGFVMGVDRQRTYAQSIETVEMSEDSTELPSFHQRQPYNVASAVSSRTLGNTTGDATGVVKAIPSREVFTTSVNKRGWLTGYESTQVLNVAPFGTTPNSNVSFCRYSEDAGLRMRDTFIFNSLQRAIYHKEGMNTIINSEDAFVVCEDSDDSDEPVPYVYVPMIEKQGIFNPINTFGGLAIYNGHTGDIEIQDTYSGDLPVYPSSLAETQRASSGHIGSIPDWIFKRAGWEDTSGDSGNPNGANLSEFVLASEDLDTTYFVTPLTPRGDNQSIVGIGTVVANDELTSGALKPYTVYQYAQGKERAATSTVASSITGEILSGYRSSGLSVFEVIPAENGTWVATIGKDQSILYRASVDVDGYITLRDSKGNVIGTNAPGETVDEEAVEDTDPNASEGDQAPPVSVGDKPIEEMSEEEIKSLIEQGVEELIRRGESPVDGSGEAPAEPDPAEAPTEE